MVTGIGPQRVTALLRAVASTDKADRLDACGVVSDIFRELSDLEATVLATVLAWMVIQEEEAECREAALYCLSTLVDWDLAPTYSYSALGALDRETLHGSEVEYFDHLFPDQPDPSPR